MTNQEWLCNLSAKEFLNRIKWLLLNYGKRWTDSDPAIIEWLQGKHEVNTPEDKGMTREEQLDWLCRLRSEIYVYMPKEWLIPMNDALGITIKYIKQESILDKIRAEIIENSIEDYKYHGCGGDELIIETSEVLEIIDKYRSESEE